MTTRYPPTLAQAYERLASEAAPHSVEYRTYAMLARIITIHGVAWARAHVTELLPINAYLRDNERSAPERVRWQTRIDIFQQFLEQSNEDEKEKKRGVHL